MIKTLKIAIDLQLIELKLPTERNVGGREVGGGEEGVWIVSTGNFKSLQISSCEVES